MKLLIVNGSIRQGRASDRVTKWVENNVATYGLENVEFETIDLKELALPLFDEPISPLMNPDRVTEGNVKVWLDALAGADGYIFITPEYNHAMGNGLKNAIDYIAVEVMKKPFFAVGHGGVGGARAVEQIKLTLNANIGAVPIWHSVNIFGYVGYQNLIDENGTPTEAVVAQEASLKAAVEDLVWYADALKTAREK